MTDEVGASGEQLLGTTLPKRGGIASISSDQLQIEAVGKGAALEAGRFSSSVAQRKPRRALVTAFSEVNVNYVASALVLQQSAQEVGGVEFEYVALVLSDPDGPEWTPLRAR